MTQREIDSTDVHCPLRRDAGFDRVDEHAHTYDVAGVDDLIAWSTSSWFGNFLVGLSRPQSAVVCAIDSNASPNRCAAVRELS